VTVSERRETRGADLGCAGRALCGWSPPSLPADTDLKQRVDVIRLGNLAALAVVVAVVGLLNLAGHVSVRPALAADGLAGLVAGSWCLLNFWRCRHAHCLITGPGWIAFGLFALVEASFGHSLMAGYEQPVFLGVLAVAAIFEACWYAVRGTNAIVSQRT
jgi:hypothetical protein